MLAVQHTFSPEDSPLSADSLEVPMRTPRILLIAGLCTTAALTPGITACGSDGNGGTTPNIALYAAWNVTSFVGLGTDFIADGMTMVVTIDAAGTYTAAVTNDLIGTCSPGPDCVTGGDFTATATRITLDPGSQNEVTFNYSIAGTAMTWTGNIDGNPVTITMERV
jgi:hypothetical protein